MSQLLARIMLVIFMIPLGLVVYLAGIAWGGHLSRSGYPDRLIWECVSAGILTWIFVGVYWILLWRSTVRWTNRRRGLTFLCVAISVCGAAVLGVAASAAERELGYIIGSVAAPALWLVGTTLVWRESVAERGERLRSLGKGGVACPTCGYNLTGLSAARCPECGTQYTLDELMAAQPGAETGELDG